MCYTVGKKNTGGEDMETEVANRIVDTASLRAYAEVDTAALRTNYRKLVGRVQAAAQDRGAPAPLPIAVVKANAYGHDIRLCIPALAEEGCRAFAVACIEEAVTLRCLLEELPAPAGETPPADSLILILGYTPPAQVARLAQYRLTAALVSADHAGRMSEAACAAHVRVSVHIALDTGMNRIGLAAHTPEECRAAVRAAAEITALPGLSVEGMFTHFAEADGDMETEMADGSRTAAQYERFAAVRDGLTALGLRPALCHICNSAASVRFPTAHPDRLADAVRLGIELYGYGVPFPDDTPPLSPVLRLCTSVAHIHELLPGERVGYGGTYSSPTPRRLATLPVGYADGWLRAFSGATVTVCTRAGEKKAPVVGRVCMDQCMIDITDLPVEQGDPVLLFGQETAELEALAERARTIDYELLCLITSRVPRIQQDGDTAAKGASL